MASLKFIPADVTTEAAKDVKVLVAARQCKVPIRFGCASARCGTCAVKISNPSAVQPMKADELALLTRMNLPTSGDVRLACQARTTGNADTIVDISFQDTYSPDDLEGDGSL